MQRARGQQAIMAVLVIVLALAAASPALADPTYTAMNAEGGIYWRSEPNWNAAERISGFGVYNGTTIAVHCYQSGTSVPGSANTMWEQATDVAGSGYGSGWLNEHFINDGQPINQPSPGVPPCNAPPPPGLVFAVFNAEGGIYYRDSPHWADTSATPGVGVYNGDRVDLICGAFGDAVGPYNDTAWSYVNNLSRSVGEGWVNEHFINDGALSNQFVSGEPMCGPGTPGISGGETSGGGSGTGGGSGSSTGSGAPPSLPEGGSAYFAPDDGHSNAPSPATLTRPYDSWRSKTHECGTEHADVPASWGNKLISTLAGFSKGRLGPIYFLQANRSHWSRIHYILLFDPAGKSEYEYKCDRRYPQSQLLAEWLSLNSGNRLVIVAGKITADAANPDHGHGHAGIQDTLFPKIRGRSIASRVVVCNYNNMGHWDVFRNFSYTMNQPPITKTTCPRHAFGWSP